ncbi:nuclear transport factor 2 family protein [Gallaecimonas kandeliae]|uniref:YybH family protein n=1 Tax=Gallaecimonas kandeliae TaxID=3029055 RepID=UPI002647D7C0|nr:nuclear transport factor 2 family protein [Gallaecimonas kandeliae]WKE65404.1 nuclear transport factor 2 family protein [Gallaecimonas kandeliae]
MKKLMIILLLLASPRLLAATADEGAIRTLLAGQAAAWSQGDLAGFMAPYWHSPKLRFASGGDVTYGWQATFDRYRAHYQDKAAMGRLSFEIREVRLMGEHALVFGHWQLDRQKDQPQGLFTLLLAKLDGRWQIVADHTSSAH